MYTDTDVNKAVGFFYTAWSLGEKKHEPTPFSWWSIQNDGQTRLSDVAATMLDEREKVNDWLGWETTSRLLRSIGVDITYSDFFSFARHDDSEEEEDDDRRGVTDGSEEFLVEVFTKLSCGNLGLNTNVEDWL